MLKIRRLSRHQGCWRANDWEDDELLKDMLLLKDMFANWDEVDVSEPRASDEKRAQYMVAKYVVLYQDRPLVA
jgi:hypothetical protein